MHSKDYWNLQFGCWVNMSRCSLVRNGSLLRPMVRISVLYKNECASCRLSYIGSTAVQMSVRIAQHKGESFRTKLPLTKPSKSSIRDHCKSANHGFKIENFSILDSTFYSQDLRILEFL